MAIARRVWALPHACGDAAAARRIVVVFASTRRRHAWMRRTRDVSRLPNVRRHIEGSNRMPATILRVPIRVDGLYVAASTPFAATLPMANFAALPYSYGATADTVDTGNPDT